MVSADDGGPAKFVAKLADLEFGYQDETGGGPVAHPHRVQEHSQAGERQGSMPPAIPDTVRRRFQNCGLSCARKKIDAQQPNGLPTAMFGTLHRR